MMLFVMTVSAQNGPVNMWEGTIELPTYKVNPPEKAPLFERDFVKRFFKSLNIITKKFFKFIRIFLLIFFFYLLPIFIVLSIFVR